MRILVAYPYIAYQDVALEFLERLATCGNEVIAIFACDRTKISCVYESTLTQVKLYGVPSIELSPIIAKSIVQRYPCFLHLSNIIREVSPDLIVVMSPLFLASAQVVRKAIKNRKPTVLDVHGVYAERGVLLYMMQNAYLHTIGRWVLKNSTLIRCLHRSDAVELTKFGAHLDKIRTIPNAVNTDLFKPSKERDENSLIWVGRMVPEKGLTYLIKALTIVVKEYSLKDISLRLVGDGPQLSVLLRMVRKFDLNKHVRFLGSRSRKEVASTLARSSLFVFPSLREGMPLSVLEAMSCGLPVIGSKVIGLKNLVVDGYNGLLVPPKDPKSLADAITLLMVDDNLRGKLAKNARDHIMRKHTYDKILPKLQQMYFEALRLT